MRYKANCLTSFHLFVMTVITLFTCSFHFSFYRFTFMFFLLHNSSVLRIELLLCYCCATHSIFSEWFYAIYNMLFIAFNRIEIEGSACIHNKTKQRWAKSVNRKLHLLFVQWICIYHDKCIMMRSVRVPNNSCKERVKDK